MKYEFPKTDYTLIYSILSSLSGGKVLHVVHPILQDIATKSDEGKADKIELDIELYVLEIIVGALVDVATKQEIKMQDLMALRAVATLLKVSKAFNAELDTLIPKESKLELDSNLVLD